VRSATITAALCCLLAMAGCGGSSYNYNPNDNGSVYSVTVTCDPTTIQSGGTSQCTSSLGCTGKACMSYVYLSASAGSINYAGVFTAPETDTSLQVTITGTVPGTPPIVGTTIVTVNP